MTWKKYKIVIIKIIKAKPSIVNLGKELTIPCKVITFARLKLGLENFDDGKNPGRKGLSQRVGIPKNATMAQLQKAAKSGGEKGRLARWQINMRRGRKKKKWR